MTEQKSSYFVRDEEVMNLEALLAVMHKVHTFRGDEKVLDEKAIRETRHRNADKLLVELVRTLRQYRYTQQKVLIEQIIQLYKIII
jgi:hypothetical protein